MAYRIEFFETSSGRCPVKQYIEEVPESDQGEIINAIDLLQDLGFDLLGTKFMKKITGDLFELRIKGEQLHRALFFHHTQSGFVFVHAYTKQTDKTPEKEIRTAETRMKAWYASQNKATDSKR